MNSTNPRDVAYIFREYALKIHAKALPSDPNYLAICVICGQVSTIFYSTQSTFILTDCTCASFFALQIDQWAERHYPSFIEITRDGDGVKAVYNESDLRAGIYSKQKKKRQAPNANEPTAPQRTDLYLMLFVVGGVLLVCAIGLGLAWAIAVYLGSVTPSAR